MSKIRSNKSKFKIQRRLSVELPGLSKPGALAKRNYAPGIHGQRRSKLSEYGLRLYEKQKIVFNYGLRENQMRRFVVASKRKQSANWLDYFFGLVESRLDNVVFRLGFARSIAAARQMVSHGHIRVNKKKIDIASYIVQIGDTISVDEKTSKSTAYIANRKEPRLELPDYLTLEKDGDQEVGKLVSQPNRTHVPFPLNFQFIIEYYGKVKK